MQKKNKENKKSKELGLSTNEDKNQNAYKSAKFFAGMSKI
jgi:hypothetical protein